MTFVYLFGLSISLFLFLLLVMKWNKSSADRILTAWIGFMTLHISLFLADYFRFSYQYPHLLGLMLPLPILHGAFLYWYTAKTIGKRISTANVMLHLVPFVLLVALAVPFYSMSAPAKLEVFLNKGKGFEWYQLIQSGLFVVFGLGYSIASIITIRKHRKNLLNVVSNLEKGRLLWLESIAYGFIVIWLIVFPADDAIIFLAVSIFVLFIGVFGVNRTPVFFSVESKPEKYQKTGLSDTEGQTLSNSLQVYMETNKPYRNPDLTLDELASMVKISPNQLSQVINGHSGRTFYHYVNSFRIREFIELSAQPDSRKFTFLGLAYECGFQSKTTFNKYFKLETGRTPSEYFTSADPYNSQALSPAS
jgi:AraC-like DNA-binding protein